MNLQTILQLLNIPDIISNTVESTQNMEVELKMKLINRIVSVLLAAFLCLSVTVPAFADDMVRMTLDYDGQTHKYEAKPVRLIINGEELTGLTMPPIILNDLTLVPVREVIEALGAVVDWKADTREIYIAYDDTLIILQVDNEYANVSGNMLQMSQPPKIINDKTMVPLSFVSRNLGFSVNWDGDNRIVYIYEPDDEFPVIDDNYTDNNYTYNNNTGTAVATTPQAPAITVPSSNVISSGAKLSRDVSAGDITKESHELTGIESIYIPTSSEPQSFKIKASSAISRVDKTLWDNKLAIDIYNAEMKLGQKEYPVENNPVISQIRAAQNQVDPDMIVRVVFDLTAQVDYSVSLSADRKTISVDFHFERNSISNISFSSDGSADYLYVTGAAASSTAISSDSNPERLVLDIPYADLVSAMNQQVVGSFVYSVNARQYDADNVRIELYMNAYAKYIVSEQDGVMVVKLVEPSYRNIRYTVGTRTITIQKPSGLHIDINAIRHSDDYNNLKYTLTLNGDYSSLLGYGEYVINDEYLSSIQMDTIGSNTQLIFNEKQILCYDVSEDNQYIYINILKPKEKYSHIVVIDPGHGGDKPGTIINGTVEKDLTLDYGLRLIQLLENDGRYKVYSTRTKDVNPSFEERSGMANQIGDIFVSIHINSVENNAVANGVEVWYHPHDNDALLGFSSKQMAGIILRNILAGTGAKDRSVKDNVYLVLINTQVPAVLCEMGFLTNPDEYALLTSPEYRQKGAEAIYKGIVEAFQQYTPKR